MGAVGQQVAGERVTDNADLVGLRWVRLIDAVAAELVASVAVEVVRRPHPLVRGGDQVDGRVGLPVQKLQGDCLRAAVARQGKAVEETRMMLNLPQARIVVGEQFFTS